MGRASEFTQEVADAICERLAGGESLRAICREEAMPGASTVLGWLREEALAPFAEQYARARELGYQLLADEIIEIADTPLPGVEKTIKPNGDEETKEGDMLGHRKLQIDARKWMLSKMLPKVYGDKVTNEHTGPNGGPVQIIASQHDENL